MKFPLPSSRAIGVYWDRVSSGGIAEIASFLTKHWDKHSPVPNLRRIESPLVQQWNEAFVQNRVEEGICLKAVEERTGDIVALGLSKIVHREKPSTSSAQELARLTSLLPNAQLESAVVETLYKNVDLFAKYGVQAYMNLGKVYIAPEFRRQMLAIELLYLMIAEAQRTQGIRLFASVAASLFVQKGLRAEKNLAFQMVNELDYSTYKVGDEYPFKNDGIHQKAQLYAAWVPLLPPLLDLARYDTATTEHREIPSLPSQSQRLQN